MALIIEDGSGVYQANAYQTVAEVTAYLTSRNRQTENGWNTSSTGAKEAAIIAGTDFVERRFRERFKGIKKWRDIAEARTMLTFTQAPLDGETVTIGSEVFTFRTTPTLVNDVGIGDNAASSSYNLAIKTSSVLTTVNAFAFFGDLVLFSAIAPGTAGNGIAVATNVTGASFSFPTLRGGNDDKRPQPLSFPRTNMYDRDGYPVLNIPDRLKQSIAEYAVRALAGVLDSDIVPDATGRVVTGTKVKVGPIETETRFEESGQLQLAIYPAADGLLSEFLIPGGGAFR